MLDLLAGTMVDPLDLLDLMMAVLMVLMSALKSVVLLAAKLVYL